MVSKALSLFVLLLATFSSHAVVSLSSGESYATSFTLLSDGGAGKETDNYWDMVFTFSDSNNPPFSSGGSMLTVTLFENTNLTGPSFMESIDSSLGAAPGAVFTEVNQTRFSDLSGSLRVTYIGTGVATLQQITIANFAGTMGDSFVATTTFEPMASPVPWPSAAMLFLPGLLLTAVAASRRRAG